MEVTLLKMRVEELVADRETHMPGEIASSTYFYVFFSSLN